MDLLQREGRYPIPPQAPKTLGVEFSGMIDSEAEDAESEFKVGDEVFGLAYGGTSPTIVAIGPENADSTVHEQALMLSTSPFPLTC